MWTRLTKTPVPTAMQMENERSVCGSYCSKVTNKSGSVGHAGDGELHVDGFRRRLRERMEVDWNLAFIASTPLRRGAT